MEEQEKDPFAEFGGTVVTQKEDPFKEFGGTVVSKKDGLSGGPNTLPPSLPGSNSFPTSQASGDLTPVLPEYRDEVRHQQQAKIQEQSDRFKKLRSELPKEAQDNWDKAIQIANSKHPDELSAPTKEEIDHYNFMQTPVGKTLGAVGYIGSQAAHGTVQMAKGLAHVASLANNPVGVLAGTPEPTDEAFKKIDKLADLGLTASDKARIEQGNGIGNHLLSATGQAANFAPSVALGEASGVSQLPKALLYLQGIGQGKETADKIPDLNPAAKEALIQGSGAVNMALADFGGKFFGKGVSNAVKDKVVTGIAIDALKEASEKGLSEDGFKNLLTGKAQSFAEKFNTAPAEILKHYTDAAKTFTKINVGNYAVHKAVDAINDKPVFNETLGNLAENENKSLTQDVPIFGTAGAVGAASKLLPNSGYENDVTKSVIDNPTKGNIDNIKYDIEQHGHENGWNTDEINATHSHIDKIADAVNSLPSNIKDKTKAVGLVLDRNELQGELDQSKGEREKLDPALAEIPSSKEQYLTDKIEQANDKLRGLATGKKSTYSKGIGEEEGNFFKTTDTKKEDITPERYDLENMERDSKKQSNEPSNENVPGKEEVQPVPATDEQPIETPQSANVIENDKPAEVVEKPKSENPVERPKVRVPTPEYKDIREETIANHGENTPENLSKEANSKIWYHGSNKDLTNEHVSSAAFTRPDSLLGLGFYMTDNPDIAEKYANLRRNKNSSTVNEFKVKTSKLLDAEKPIDNDVAELYKKTFQSLFDGGKSESDEFFDKVKKDNPKASLMDYHKAIREHIADSEMTTNDVTEHFQDLEGGLKDELGYDGISHIGGKTLGGKEVPADKLPEESALNKESVKANRKVIGLNDVNKPESLEGDQEYRKAAEKVRNGSLSPYDIAEHIIRTRETPTIEQFNALLYQNRVIDNQYEQTLGKIEDAEKNGSPEDKEDARNELLVLERNKDLLHNAARNVSYNWGFMGRMLQEAVKKDYTLSNLKSLFRAKSDGKIPEDIEAKLNQYVKERDEAVKNLQDYQSKEAERKAQVIVERERRSGNRKVAVDKLDKAIEDTFASISKKLKAQRETLSMNPIPVEMLPDIGKLVSYYTQKGIIKATDIADNIYSRLKDDIEGLTKKDVIDAMAGNGYQKETKTLDELQKQKADIKLQAKLISRLEDIESGRVKPSLLKSNASISEEVKSLRERIRKAAIDQGIPLDNYKKNLQAKLDELEQKIRDGDYSREKKQRAYEPDQEALRLRAKVRRTEKLIDELGANLDQRREKNVNKFLDGYTKIHRFFILSRIGTLAKLRVAAMARQITSPVEEVLGAINKEIPGFRKIAERSPRFSKGFKISAEVKALSEHYTKQTIADNNQVLKEGHGELDYLFDPKAQKETEMSGFPGRLHAWLKNSTKRAEWQRSFEHIMQWEKDNNPNIDINDPAVQERVGKEAYNEARRSIFMGDNMAVDLYNNVLQFAERNWGTTGKAVATAFRALMPIVKIPTNFALEATDYATGGARAIPTILKAAFKGAESLSPKEADFVMRMMRKGQLGGALMAIAYFNPNHFGGYNISGQKRDKNDLKIGDMTIGGVKVPHLLQHVPLISAMQAAATLRRSRDYNIEKGKETHLNTGSLDAFMGLMESVPFLSAPSELEEALKSDSKFNTYFGQVAKNQAEPGILQEAAEQTDTKDGSFATINPENAQKRYPDAKDGLGTSIKENLMAGVPGLREKVSSEKPSEVDKAVKKIKLPNGPEFDLNDEQVKDRQKVNDEFIKKNEDRLKSALERKALTDKELLKKITDKAKVWKEHDVPAEEKKKFKQELVDAYVEHHIKLIANKNSMPYIYKKYKGKLKPVEE